MRNCSRSSDFDVGCGAMILRPSVDSHRVIGKYTGKILVGLGILMTIPFICALLYQEWITALDFAISFSLCMIVGYGAQAFFRTDRDLSWSEGLVVAAGSWIWAVLLAAVPYYLSGHMGSYLDACFDVMSGFTTTGLFLLQDLDHLSNGMNMWRHVLTYAGGQGIVVIALTFLFKGTAGAYKMYVGEGKDERLLPNVVQTARAIWLVSIVYLVIGTTVMTVVNWWLGMEPSRAVFIAIQQFMGVWSTGGFAPTSYNGMYYHSLVAEIVIIVIAVAGSFNFALHWAIWTGKRKEILRNIEIVTFSISLLCLTALAMWGLVRAGVYSDSVGLARKAFYILASGHTTTGMGTIYARSFVTLWGPVGMIATIVAMGIGASACSTAGGLKVFRLGIFIKGVFADIKKTMLPESAVLKVKFHHVKDSYLTDKLVKSAAVIIVLYLFAYISSGVLGVLYGYDFLEALFEGVSAMSDSGLSCGVTSPAMPNGMKIAYIIYMWLGRLEFLSIFAVGGYLYSVLRGR